MRKKIFLISLLFITLFSLTAMGQQKSDIIGAIDDQVSLQKHGDQYLITYMNYNLNTEKANGEFIVEDKATLNRLYNLIMDGFESISQKPIQFELKNDELRLYYKNKTMGKDMVEIIHENIETEETGTILRLTKKDVQRLFGME